eukprot:GCRY01001234.1.p1 GENE.GCRY01001234.1~~GCRY01001234.1.p1  ORF type:complete len:143 (-),score=30.10 GCRY01001234.1:86-460(-)
MSVEIGQQFVSYYYSTFDSNRAGLAGLYTNESMLTFEGGQFLGVEAIMKKLTEGLSFKEVRHQGTSVDVQPTKEGMLVFVCGHLMIDGNTEIDKALKFSQVFQLLPTASGSYYVFNDIFRLNYG